MNQPPPGSVTLRPLLPADLPEIVDMWVAAWQAAYPSIDFEARRGWIVEHIAELERGGATSIIAVTHDSKKQGRLAGLLLVNPQTGYLDQLVVAHDLQGQGIAALLLAEARGLSPQKLSLHVNQDNTRAVRFYEKHGFVKTGEDVNPRSGAPIYLMGWKS